MHLVHDYMLPSNTRVRVAITMPTIVGLCHARVMPVFTSVCHRYPHGHTHLPHAIPVPT